MDRSWRPALLIALALIAALATAVGWWNWKQSRLPRLVSVRVVLQASGESVASNRMRLLPAGSTVEAAAVVSFRAGSGPERRVCGLSPVELDGVRVAVEPLADWPKGVSCLRAAWYTVEPSLFGWTGVGPGDARERLAYRDFLAPELGRGLVAEVPLVAHDDDFLSAELAGNRLPAGVLRVKVRVSSYRGSDELVPKESVASPGAQEILTARVPGFAVELRPLPGVAPGVARLLRLGCFTFAPGVWPDGGPGWPLAATPSQLVARGLIVTPQALAAAAAGGDPLHWPWRRESRLQVRGDALLGPERLPLRWGKEVTPGDAVRSQDRFYALVADDGDGVLSLGDRVLFAWKQPAYFASLADALGSVPPALELLRLAEEGAAR
jgi:hypothetical protein